MSGTKRPRHLPPKSKTTGFDITNPSYSLQGIRVGKQRNKKIKSFNLVCILCGQKFEHQLFSRKSRKGELEQNKMSQILERLYWCFHFSKLLFLRRKSLPLNRPFSTNSEFWWTGSAGLWQHNENWTLQFWRCNTAVTISTHWPK